MGPVHPTCQSINSRRSASYGTRTRSNTVTGCRADPHTYEATGSEADRVLWTKSGTQDSALFTPYGPRQELNLDLELRTLAWSPVHHGDESMAQRGRMKAEGRKHDTDLLF